MQDFLYNTPNLSKFSDKKILKLNGIIENSTGKIRPTLAGMMVFGEYPQGYLPQLFIACVVVPERKLGDIEELGQRFDDRIEILNPGDLYGNNRIENLGTDNMLKVRNNTIIRILEETTDNVTKILN